MRSIREIKTILTNGDLDEKLAYLYCRKKDEIQPFRDRVFHIIEGYQKTFEKDDSAQAGVFSAPGRTEIGGNHTDHQRGKVLTGSVDLDALACAGRNGTKTVNIFSEGYGLISIDIADLAPVKMEENTTYAIIRGMVAKIASLGYSAGGFDAYVISDVPGGSGLSSSACFEVLLGTLINGLFCEERLSMEEIARIGQYAENVYFGKPSGLLDQMGCALGGIVAIDFFDRDNPKITPVRFDFASAGHALCIIDTGADHADLTDEYAAVPAEMKSVAAAFGREVLCEVNEDDFYRAVPQLRNDLGDRAVMRAIHYYTDCHRVEKMVAALEKDDFLLFLRLVSSSGHSSYMYLQNVDSFRDPRHQPVGLALAMAGHYLNNCGARRVHGGGFGGSIQTYVPLDMVERFKTGMDALLGEGACRVTYIRPIGGCTLID
ncbi:MAG: galactokinase family protein [Clostridia bacterium]